MRNTCTLLGLLYILVSWQTSFAQSSLIAKEKWLGFYCDVMVNAAEGRHRAVAMDSFNTAFLEALSQPSSFSYPFDSLKWISRVAPEDSTFRIFSWEVRLSPDDYRYFGVLQLKNGRSYALTDIFDSAEDIMESEFTSDRWLGGVYYNLLTVKDKKRGPYYILFGLHRMSRMENVKFVDPLFFSAESLPYFGKPVFSKKDADPNDPYWHRLLFRYASDAQVTVNYNPGMEMIVADHLIERMGRIPGQGRTMVPDGSYIGFEQEGYVWKYIDKIATQVSETAPRPQPVLDERKGKKIFGNER